MSEKKRDDAKAKPAFAHHHPKPESGKGKVAHAQNAPGKRKAHHAS